MVVWWHFLNSDMQRLPRRGAGKLGAYRALRCRQGQITTIGFKLLVGGLRVNEPSSSTSSTMVSQWRTRIPPWSNKTTCTKRPHSELRLIRKIFA